MKNVRRFQRATLVCFAGLNSIVFTNMKGFGMNDQILFVMTIVLGTTLVLLLLSKRKKSQQVK